MQEINDFRFPTPTYHCRRPRGKVAAADHRVKRGYDYAYVEFTYTGDCVEINHVCESVYTVSWMSGGLN